MTPNPQSAINNPPSAINNQHIPAFSQAILQSLCDSPRMVTAPLNGAQAFPPLTPPDTPCELAFNQKLGHLYEDALHHLLVHAPRYSILAHNQQIITPNKITLGELDYLLRDEESQELIHLELAVKFYLVHHAQGSTTFPGPDARDNYQKKLQRLSSHQLTLSQRPEARATLQALLGEPTTPIQSQHLIHGIFFDHIAAPTQPVPEHASPHTRRLPWLHVSELPDHFPELQHAHIIPKQLWLCHTNPSLVDRLYLADLPTLTTLGQQRCTLFLPTPHSQPTFLAPDTWPHTPREA
ncbi:DUF1853 family protein [Rubritalea tangerina]|uniref:DUF1853 family protein n=1 Tax=Rubritalea tangerina TaxID=430798 RepID=A0ABW4ZBQ4_9BACT